MKYSPVNKNASKEAIALLNYLKSIEGKGVIVGQHTQTLEQIELWYQQRVTGKLPALCGFELLSYSPNINYDECDKAALKEINENKDTLKRAFEWAEKGGIITFTWHWFSPIGGRDKSFFSKNTDFDAERALQEGTEENKAFYNDMKQMSNILSEFCEKGIPILWRPFHEAEGNWFWWGAKGMDVSRRLYRAMYRFYTEECGLNNLIWVWNNPKPEGYVGDEYCDIVTRDLYPPEHQHTSLAKEYDEICDVTNEKPFAIGEIGTIPSIDDMCKEGVNWLWFMTWSFDFGASEKFTTNEVFNSQFNHPYAITLDKLPKIY